MSPEAQVNLLTRQTPRSLAPSLPPSLARSLATFLPPRSLPRSLAPSLPRSLPRYLSPSPLSPSLPRSLSPSLAPPPLLPPSRPLPSLRSSSGFCSVGQFQVNIIHYHIKIRQHVSGKLCKDIARQLPHKNWTMRLPKHWKAAGLTSAPNIRAMRWSCRKQRTCRQCCCAANASCPQPI